MTDVEDRVVALELESGSVSSGSEDMEQYVILRERDQNIAQHREGAKVQQHKQAEQMLKSSQKKVFF